jgi:type VI secretion system secreted protein VgrG
MTPVQSLPRCFSTDNLPTQKDRPMTIETPYGPDVLLLKSMTLTESVSAPFELHCDLLTVFDLGDLKDLLQRPVGIRLETDSVGTRFFHAYVQQVSQVESTNSFHAYSIVASPKVWFLDLVNDCRIFQEQTVPEIVSTLLKEHNIEHRESLRGTYEKRSYCVQYRESIFHFISRLCEEEGIYYYFEHRQGGHTMVFADMSTVAKEVPGEEVIFFNAHHVENPQDRVVYRIHRSWTAANDSYIHNDFNFQWPRTRMEASVQGPESNLGTYDYPGLYEVQKKGQNDARLRLEQLECSSSLVEAETTIPGLSPGYRSLLKGHHSKSFNQNYFITSVKHEAVDNNYRSQDCKGDAQPFQYRNKIRAIPATLPYRQTSLHEKAEVRGTQTAIVVGPDGQEIYTDEYGRVKVQFHWDRLGKRNHRSSCWIRVSQTWGGGRWGGITIPRIGQEVIVDFLEGNPDRPIITGRVYNSDQMPPYELPANAHRSGTKTQSLGGGGGFNEFSMSDAGGSEQIFMHAQKDMDTVVQNNQTLAVGSNRMKQIGVNESVAIGNNLTEFVGNSQQTVVTNAYKIDCDTFHLNAKTSITLVTGGSRIHMNQAGVITITGNLITVAATVLSTITAPITAVTGVMALSLNGMLCNIASTVTNVYASCVARINGGKIKLNC